MRKPEPGAVGVSVYEHWVQLSMYSEPDMENPVATMLLSLDHAYNLAQRLSMTAMQIEDGKK